MPQQITVSSVSRGISSKKYETEINIITFSGQYIMGQIRVALLATTYSLPYIVQNFNTTGNYVMSGLSSTLTTPVVFDKSEPAVQLKEIPIEEAKRVIYQYVKKHQGSRTSDLIIELGLDPDLVIEALSQLKCEGKMEGKDIASK